MNHFHHVHFYAFKSRSVLHCTWEDTWHVFDAFFKKFTPTSLKCHCIDLSFYSKTKRFRRSSILVIYNNKRIDLNIDIHTYKSISNKVDITYLQYFVLLISAIIFWISLISWLNSSISFQTPLMLFEILHTQWSRD